MQKRSPSTSRPSGGTPQGALRARQAARRRALWLGGTAALIVLVALVSWILFQQSKSGPIPPLPAGVETGVTPGGDPSIGSPKAPVTIEEYADFQCPFCGQFARDTEPNIITAYVAPGTARIIWHSLAFIGQESTLAAQAARCAQDQGKFWEYHTLLFLHQRAENSGGFAAPRLEGFARDAGLDAGAFRTCLSSNRYLAAVQDETKAAESRGVTSTPTFFINGQKATGALSFAQIAPLIDAARAAHP